MGQDSQKAANVASVEAGWKGYEQQLKDSRKSDVSPYYQHEIRYLQGIFTSLDAKNMKSIDLQQMDQIFFLKQHPLYERIRVLYQEQIKKLKVKKISFDIMLHLFSTFHIETNIEVKYKYLFRLYDWDKDFKLTAEDLIKTFEIMFSNQRGGGNNYGNLVYSRESFQVMASQALAKYGVKGEIKFQLFREFIQENQVKQVLTFRFSSLT